MCPYLLHKIPNFWKHSPSFFYWEVDRYDEGMYSLDLGECQLRQEEVGLVWRLCPRLKRLDIGVRRGTRGSLSTTGLIILRTN